MPAPGPAVFRHFLDVVAGHAGAIYGRRIYEVMRYWDDDQPDWDAVARDFAAAWRAVGCDCAATYSTKRRFETNSPSVRL